MDDQRLLRQCGLQQKRRSEAKVQFRNNHEEICSKHWRSGEILVSYGVCTMLCTCNGQIPRSRWCQDSLSFDLPHLHMIRLAKRFAAGPLALGGMKHAKSWHLYTWPSEVVSGRTNKISLLSFMSWGNG